jgi:PQQ-like domain
MKFAARLITPLALLTAALVPAVSPAHASSDAAPGGTRLWVQTYTGGTGRNGAATSLATSPDRPVVYVTGATAKTPSGTGGDVSTLAYDSHTGAVLWQARYQSAPYHPGDPSIVVSPDGSTVFVAAYLRNRGGPNIIVLAYSAVNGALLWTYQPPDFGRISLASEHPLAVSPDSTELYVATSTDQRNPVGYITFALDAGKGSVDWTAQQQWPQPVYHADTSVAVSPDGSAVFVTGQAGTVAYGATSGAVLWQDHFKRQWDRYPAGLVVSPDSSTIYITSRGLGGSHEFWLTEAYSTATGARTWVTRYPGGPNARAYAPSGLVVSPDGSELIVAGRVFKHSGPECYETVAYDAATGTQLWAQEYLGPPGVDTETDDVAITPDGAEVVVTGSVVSPTGGYLTVAYDATTGARLWVAKLRGLSDGTSFPEAVAVSPDSARIFITGSSVTPGDTALEYLTVAYHS